MEQKGLIKKLSAVLLVTTMGISVFAQFSTLVFAEERANDPEIEEKQETGTSNLEEGAETFNNDKDKPLDDDSSKQDLAPMDELVPVDATNVYVSELGNDNNTGTKENPFKTLQKAMDTVSVGGNVTILTDLVTSDSTLINKNVHVFGATESGNPPVLTQSAELTSMFIVEGVPVSFENINFSGAGIDNFGPNDNAFYGGAINTKSNSNVTVNHCTFTEFEGHQGGAIASPWANDVAIHVNNSRFEKNRANVGGAAIGTETGTNYALYVDGSTFINNDSDYKGGAIFVNVANSNGSQNINISNSTFEHNDALNDGGAISLQSSPMEDKHVSLESNKFVNNSSGLSGGAVHLTGFKTFDLSDCLFENNRAAKHSGAVELVGIAGSSSQVNVFGNAFIENHAEKEGGAIRFGNGATQSNIGSSLFQNNVANSNLGNAIAFLASSYQGTNSYIKPTNGAAFYQNGENNDGEIIFVQMNQVDNKVSLSKRMLDGTLIDWKTDEDNTLVPVDTQNIEGKVLDLYMNPETKSVRLDPALYSNVFIGNTAKHGGAIFNYGSLHMGTEGKTIHVQKEWKGKVADYADISLKRTQYDDVLEIVKLTKESNWQYDFLDFPTNVPYEIIENSIPGYTSKIESNDDSWLITNTFINDKKPDKEESEQGGNESVQTSAQTNTTMYITLCGLALLMILALTVTKKKQD